MLCEVHFIYTISLYLLAITTNVEIKSNNKSVSIVITNHLKMGVDTTPETSHISNITQIMSNIIFV